jgi:hypothetical protein
MVSLGKDEGTHDIEGLGVGKMTSSVGGYVFSPIVGITVPSVGL